MPPSEPERPCPPANASPTLAPPRAATDAQALAATRQSIPRSRGITASEQILADLCSRTFLRLWSYPNIYRNQCSSPTNPSGKEICDLLVVCDDHLIIFSDKSCTFPSSGIVAKDWNRWFHRSIEKSASQIAGAERWLKTHPDRVFLDRDCQYRFPLPLSPWETFHVHRVVVALNAAQRCRAELGGSGSLIIDPSIDGAAHTDSNNPDYQPFAVGWVRSDLGYIHVLDDITLATVLQALDTVTDFVEYLDKKESLIKSGTLHWAPGEEDLLAVYVSHIDESGAHTFPVPEDAHRIAIKERSWLQVLSNPSYQRKIAADRDSFLWDAIIEDFSGHVFSGTLLAIEPFAIDHVETPLRIMAREPRVVRRLLAKSLKDKLARVPDGMIGVRYMLSQTQEGVGYVYLLFPYDHSAPHEHYRVKRQRYLSDCCLLFAWTHRKLREIVGIATETGLNNGGRSHDLLYFAPGEWTPAAEAEAARLQMARGLLVDGNVTAYNVDEKEYPDPQ